MGWSGNKRGEGGGDSRRGYHYGNLREAMARAGG